MGFRSFFGVKKQEMEVEEYERVVRKGMVGDVDGLLGGLRRRAGNDALLQGPLENRRVAEFDAAKGRFARGEISKRKLKNAAKGLENHVRRMDEYYPKLPPPPKRKPVGSPPRGPGSAAAAADNNPVSMLKRAKQYHRGTPPPYYPRPDSQQSESTSSSASTISRSSTSSSSNSTGRAPSRGGTASSAGSHLSKRR